MADDKRPRIEIEALTDEMLMPVARAWEELCSKYGEEHAAKLLPLLARLVTSSLIGKERSRQEWDSADAAVRSWEHQQAKRQKQAQAKAPKRARGRPQGTTKHAEELAPHLLTLQRIEREQAEREGRKPKSLSALARIMANEVTSTIPEPTPSTTDTTFLNDHGAIVAVEVVPDPPVGYFGSEAGLVRRILKETKPHRATRPKSVKKNPTTD